MLNHTDTDTDTDTDKNLLSKGNLVGVTTVVSSREGDSAEIFLRPYQKKLLEAVRFSLARGNKSPLMVAPTGSGKTHIAKAIVAGALAKGKRVLFIAPRRELIYQTSEKLDAAGIGHGIIMAGEERSVCPDVQLACVPTLHVRCVKGRMPLPDADVLIVDEAHLSVARTCREVMAAYPDAVKVGMTATPARSDGAGLGLIYDDLVMGDPVSELTQQGYLVPATYYAPTKPDLAKVKLTAGDYNRRQLGHAMNTPQLVGDVVENWARICPDRKTVVFAVNVAHSLALRDRFLAAGVSTEQLDGTTPNDERKAILQRLRGGETQVLCNCEVLTYGWDEPSISCAVMARPTKSVTRYFQMVGRVLRPFEGKHDCIVIDHAGSVDEIGFVDEPVVWSLDGKSKVQDRLSKTKPEREAKTVTCGDCGAVFRLSRTCPTCGHEYPAYTAKQVEVMEAELQQLDRSKKRANKQYTTEQKQQFYSGLIGYAKERGYKRGWAAHKYKTKFGVWPNRYDDTPMQPGPEVLGYIQHLNIRYANRRSA